jgi:hypothetical protein
MKPTGDLSQVIRRFRVKASAALDEKVHGEIAKAAVQPKPVPFSLRDLNLQQIIGLIMNKKSTRYTLATTLGLALLAGLVMNHYTTSAWAIEQAIDALQKYRAVHIMGNQAAGGRSTPIEVWARADTTGTHSDACLAKADGFTAWVSNNTTYTYVHASNTVFVDPAITVGLNPWFGPRLLTTLSKAGDCKTFEGTDAATGQKRVHLTASIESALGPQSFLIEFDVKTKLPVTMKQWFNLQRHGLPAFVFERVVYYEDLPDSIFSFEPPPGVKFAEKPLAIADANLAILADPKTGISAQGLTREEACRKILGQMWAANIDNDLTRIRQLCPLASAWTDELLREVLAQDDVVQVLQIGGIDKEGQSKLGPIALVPSRVRCQDGKVREIKMIVQFRHSEQDVSCVVHGPYGYSVEVR